MLGGVTVAGDDFDFLIFALLVFHFQGAAIGGYYLHFQLAISAIQLAVGGMVGQRVLLANILTDLLEDLAKLRLETREVGAASGHGGESLQFVVGLQVVDGLDARACNSVGTAGTAVGLAVIAQRPS